MRLTRKKTIHVELNLNIVKLLLIGCMMLGIMVFVCNFVMLTDITYNITDSDLATASTISTISSFAIFIGSLLCLGSLPISKTT